MTFQFLNPWNSALSSRLVVYTQPIWILNLALSEYLFPWFDYIWFLIPFSYFFHWSFSTVSNKISHVFCEVSKFIISVPLHIHQCLSCWSSLWLTLFNTIKTTHFMRYLVVTLDRSLSCAHHVDNVMGKDREALGAVRLQQTFQSALCSAGVACLLTSFISSLFICFIHIKSYNKMPEIYVGNTEI